MGTKELTHPLDSTDTCRLLGRIETLGLPHGREQSSRLVPGGLLADRLPVGVPAATLTLDATLALATRLGMPAAAQQLVTRRFGEANAVFSATEETAVHRVFKLYVEFRDAVRRRVRAGDASPQLRQRMRVVVRQADAASQLRAAAVHFGVAEERFEAVLAPMQQMPLGHIAAGCDRRGGEFLSVYAEVAPLP